MKKVLVVAYYFPPVVASGVLRPLGFCRYLGEYGWRPHVLTAEPNSFWLPHDLDPSLCSRLPRTLRIERVPDANPIRSLLRVRDLARTTLGISSRGTTNGDARNHLESQGGRHQAPGRLARLKELIFDRLLLFPDSERFWLRPTLRWASKLPADQRPDVLLATGGPWTNLLVGAALARRFGVPLVADFRDPWTRNPYPRSAAVSTSPRARALERAVCTAAARVVTNTRELRDQFVADYPDLEAKFVTITNGFDMDPLGTPRELRDGAQTGGPGAGPIELCHFGTVYGNRNPRALLRAVKEIFEQGGVGPGQLRLRFVGYWDVNDETCNALARELEAHGLLRRDPPIPHDVCLRQMAAANALVILQPAAPLQVPGKIYEYLATARPLVVVGGEGATASLVKRYRLGRCCPNDTSAIKELLRHLVTGEVRLESPGITDTARFHYRTLTGELAGVLNGVCDAGAPSAATGHH